MPSFDVEYTATRTIKTPAVQFKHTPQHPEAVHGYPLYALTGLSQQDVELIFQGLDKVLNDEWYSATEKRDARRLRRHIASVYYVSPIELLADEQEELAQILVSRGLISGIRYVRAVTSASLRDAKSYTEAFRARHNLVKEA